MCGIAGIVNADGRPVSAVTLQRMTDRLVHRGPDGEGQFVDGDVGLGHRRLSIIDLSPAGHQPMVSHDGRYVLTYNGEIYNFRELRGTLEAEGCQFRSRGDSEVVLHALTQWGLDALTRFNGMFAFAFFDRRERRLLLARDRYGVKPLYYWRRGSVFLFASEIKAFLDHPAFRVRLDPAVLAEYLTFQNILTHGSLFEGVQILTPGSFLELDVTRSRSSGPRSYWDFRFNGHAGGCDRAECVNVLSTLFEQAVNRQLVSDVPIGTYLSGGTDTGSITAVAAKSLPGIRSFTVGFDLSSASGLEMGFDERAAAERMAYLSGTEHYEMVLKAGDMERCMADLIWHLEEPRVGQCYPNFYAAKLAARFGKAVLGGTGGDELFGGYPWRYYRAVVNSSFDEYAEKYFRFWQRLVPAEQLQAMVAPLGPAARESDPLNTFRGIFAHHENALRGPADYVNHSLYFEAKTFLHGLLVVEDKMSMAHALETRVPFLDNDLADFAMSVPVEYKLGNLQDVARLDENEPGWKTAKYFQRTRDGKLILRDAMKTFVPEEIASAVKQGFSGPDASWYRGDSIEYVRRRLMGSDARIFEFLDRQTVRSLLEEHMGGRTNRRLLIWSLLCLEEWCEVFLEGRYRGSELAKDALGGRSRSPHPLSIAEAN